MRDPSTAIAIFFLCVCVAVGSRGAKKKAPWPSTTTPQPPLLPPSLAAKKAMINVRLALACSAMHPPAITFLSSLPRHCAFVQCMSKASLLSRVNGMRSVSMVDKEYLCTYPPIYFEIAFKYTINSKDILSPSCPDLSSFLQ